MTVSNGILTIEKVLDDRASPRTYVFSLTNSVAPAADFTGDFGALAASYGLTVRGYWRADLGVSGTAGSGKALWTNQSGTHGNIVPVTSGAADGIGTPGAGLNGHASLIQNGSTQGGKYTNLSQVAPGTTNRHKFFIGRLLATSGSFLYILRSGNEGQFDGSGDQIGTVSTGTANFKWGSVAAGSPAPTTPTSTRVLNTWYRFSHSLLGGANDVFRVGNETIGPLNTGIGALSAGTTTVGCFNDIGQLKANFEWLLDLDLEGTMANYLSFRADADAKSQTFWTNAIEI